MRKRVAFLVVVLAAASLAGAAVTAARRARSVARQRITERQLVAARAGAALCEAYLDVMAETIRAEATRFEVTPGTMEERLRAFFDRSEHFRIVSLTDEEGRPLRPVLFRDAAAPDPGGRRHPAVAVGEVGEHLRRIPRDEASRTGFGLSPAFLRDGRGPYVILGSSYQVRGDTHPTGDPCHPGSRHVLAAEVDLAWLVARLRVAVGGPHEVLLLDERFRTLERDGAVPPLTPVAGLGPARSPQAITLTLPGDAASGSVLAALSPVPRYGWSVLVRSPEWRVAPLLSSLSLAWAVASLVVLLGAAAAMLRESR
jgi:hypothetical protein